MEEETNTRNNSHFRKDSAASASIVDILDRTQGHLILKWNASRSAERLRKIGLTPLYCLIAVFFLLGFSFESWLLDRIHHALVLLAFSVLTVCVYFYYRMTGHRYITNTSLLFLFAALCLFLLYTGGLGGTGPLWYYVFPLFAFFVHRLWIGLIAVLVLFVITAWLLWSSVAGFDPEQYSRAFKVRFLAVYLVVSVMTFLYVFMRTTSEFGLDNLSRRLRDLADTDTMTGLPNRRCMRDILYREISRLRRGGKPFCIIMIDIDAFKSVNDLYGHDCGDHALRMFATEVSRALRTQDVCARWGGEEFLIVLPETGLENALRVAERIRAAVQNKSMKCGDQEFTITASMGVREFHALDELDDCLKDVDEKLMQAKQEGRNQIAS